MCRGTSEGYCFRHVEEDDAYREKKLDEMLTGLKPRGL